MKLTLPILIIILASVFIGWSYVSPKSPEPLLSQPIVFASLSPVTFQPFTARFLIYTNGTKRIFTDERYHRQAQKVYLELPDPSVVHVAEQSVTWGDFFATLPMKVEANCVTTGTNQIFCTNDQQSLKFFINGDAAPDALTRVIQPNDQLLISYGPKDDPAVSVQLQELQK